MLRRGQLAPVRGHLPSFHNAPILRHSSSLAPTSANCALTSPSSVNITPSTVAQLSTRHATRGIRSTLANPTNSRLNLEGRNSNDTNIQRWQPGPKFYTSSCISSTRPSSLIFGTRVLQSNSTVSKMTSKSARILSPSSGSSRKISPNRSYCTPSSTTTTTTTTAASKSKLWTLVQLPYTIVSGIWWVAKRLIILGIALYAVKKFLRYAQEYYVPKNNVILKLNLQRMLEEEPSTFLSMRSLSVYDVVETLRNAADDPRVLGLYVRVGGEQGHLTMAQAEEVREALLLFKSKDKPVHCFMDATDSMTDYLVAASCDKVTLQQGGLMELLGLALPHFFLAGTFEKLGIKPSFFQRYEYKSFAEMFTRKELSPPAKEAYNALIDSLFNHMITAIAKARGFTTKHARELIDLGCFSDNEAVAVGLVDQLGDRQSVISAIGHAVKPKLTGTDEPNFFSFVNYAKAVNSVERSKRGRKTKTAIAGVAKTETRPIEQQVEDVVTLVQEISALNAASHERKLEPEETVRKRELMRKLRPRVVGKDGVPKIAVVFANGGIERGHSTGRAALGASSTCELLRRALRDTDVKAVIIRVNSPGGDAIASAALMLETQRLKDNGLIVVVSMGDMAASGGYYMACAADKIVAHPCTITGSIGVVGGKLVLSEFLKEKLGVTHEVTARGELSQMNSALSDYSKTERSQMNRVFDYFYQDFVARVAEGRNMSFADVHKVAKGRVWSGTDALEIGLVDELGGFTKAIEVTKSLLPPLPEGADYVVIPVLPRGIFDESRDHPADTDDSGSDWTSLVHERNSVTRWMRTFALLAPFADVVDDVVMEVTGKSSRVGRVRMDVNDKEVDVM